MKRAAWVLVAALALLLGPFLWGFFHRDDPAPGQAGGLPWQIHVDPQGQVEALGLTLGRSTLADARAKWPDGFELALVGADDGPWELEAFAPQVQAGFVTGKTVLTAELSETETHALKALATRREPTATGHLRWRLPADLPETVWRTPLRSMAFHPGARIDEDTLWARFGTPPERLAGPEGVVFAVYPERGLVLTRTPQGRVVVQYLRPADLPALRTELTRSVADPD